MKVSQFTLGKITDFVSQQVSEDLLMQANQISLLRLLTVLKGFYLSAWSHILHGHIEGGNLQSRD